MTSKRSPDPAEEFSTTLIQTSPAGKLFSPYSLQSPCQDCYWIIKGE